MMVKKKKKQSLSIFPSKLANGKDSKDMTRGMSSSKPEQGLSSSQSRVVRCPKCHKFLQEPVDVTIYKCSGCNSILQAKHCELKNNDKDLFPSQNRSSLTPVRSIYRKYSSRTSSPSAETSYRRNHETSYIPREWIRRGDEFASARSCSSVVKFSITKKEDTTLLDLLKFVDSASDSHLSSSDKGSGERDTRRSTSSDFYELKLETFQPSLNHKLIEQQQPATRIHLEQGGGGGSLTPVRSSYRKYSSRPSSPLFERDYETSYILREWMMMTRSSSPSPSSYGYTSPFHWSQVSSSSAAASPIRFQGETSSDQKNHHWSSHQSQMHDDDSQLSIITKKEEETQQDDSASSDSSDNGSRDRVDAVTWETFEDKGIKKENIRSISSKFIDLTFQPQWNHKLRPQASLLGDGSREILVYKKETLSDSHSMEPLNNKEHVLSESNTREFDLGELKWEDIIREFLLEKSPYTEESSICDSSSKEDTKNSLLAKENQSCFIENPDQSGEDTVSAYRSHEEQSKHDEFENISERTWEDHRAGLHLEEYETNHENYTNPFEWSFSEGGAPTFHMQPVEEAQGRIEPVYLERTWTETMGDGSGLQLEEYQSNQHEWTSKRASTFPMHEHELGPMPEPGEDVSGRSVSSSTLIFNDQESSKERAVVVHEEEPWMVDENKIEVQKVGVMVEEDGPSLHLDKCTYESTFGLTESTPMFCLNELEPDNEADDESSKLGAVFHQEEEEEPVKLEDIFEWTTQRAPTFGLHDEPELRELLEPDQDCYGISESSSRADHVIPKEKEMMDHEDEPWLVELDVMAAEDGPSLDLEKFQNEKDKTVEPREDKFMLSLDDTVEKEWVKFDSELSQEDMQVNNLRCHEPPSKIAQVESGPMVSSGLTSEPYGHLYNTTEISEVVGLRHALYQTQTLTQTSPLSSPIDDTPRSSSPMHILMRSPMHGHIVSPLRSPTDSSGSCTL